MFNKHKVAFLGLYDKIPTSSGNTGVEK
jgi:hypothetical protein